VSGILDGRTAIVTGAAKGIGLAIASRFVSEGANVVMADIDEAGVQAAASALGNAEGVRCDVTDEAQVQALVADAVAKHGRIDVFVANAGIASVMPIVEMPLEEWRRVTSVNLDGVFLCDKHAGAAMAQSGGGSIINMASIKSYGGGPLTAHYSAAKAGVLSLTKTLALELRDHGVRVNCICPGWLGTDMVEDNKAKFEEILGISFDEYITHIQGRLGTPEEIAGLAVFLASERSRFSTGSAFVADGGAMASLV
jgi:NAD(P)-dependent dehydrogenase (short-subunit alcohol dehydrogenase family)